MTRYFYSADGENTAGPYMLEQLAEMSRSGEITAETLVISEDSQTGWIPFHQLMNAESPTPDTPAAASHQAIVPKSMNRQYKVIVLTTGCFTQTLDPARLQDTLNKEARGGWRFAKSIHEEKKVLGIFSREAHFLIFERDA